MRGKRTGVVLPRCINFQKDRSSYSENSPQQHRKSFQRLDKTLSKVDQLQKQPEEKAVAFSEVNETLVKEKREEKYENSTRLHCFAQEDI